ncbi:MAG: DUF6768 family protein [Pseudomonadota bacterium]
MTDNFDKRLFGELTADDAAFLEQLEEDRGLYTQMADAFAGPMRYWTVFAFVLSLVFFVGALYSLNELWAGPPLRESMLWLAMFGWLILAVAMIKIWFWMRLNQITLLRELKKIELQVSRLSTHGG